jgi:hypothetical protein
VYTSYRCLRRNLKAGNYRPAFWAAAIKKIGTSLESIATMKRNLCIGAAFLALIAALGFGPRMLEKKTAGEAGSDLLPNRP